MDNWGVQPRPHAPSLEQRSSAGLVWRNWHNKCIYQLYSNIFVQGWDGRNKNVWHCGWAIGWWWGVSSCLGKGKSKYVDILPAQDETLHYQNSTSGKRGCRFLHSNSPRPSRLSYITLIQLTSFSSPAGKRPMIIASPSPEIFEWNLVHLKDPPS